MKKIILTLLFTGYSFAYEVGDKLDASIIEQLKIDQNKIIVVDFFASWCHSCKKEIPLVSRLNTKLDKSRVEIIGIDVDRKLEDGVAFQKSLQADARLNFRVVNDPKNEIIKMFKPLGMPALYIIKNGQIVDIIFGAVDNIDEKIAAKIKGL